MQLLEALFLLVLAILIARVLSGPVHFRFTYLNIGLSGILVAILGVVFEGFRWQMLPAYLAFALVLAGAMRTAPVRLSWRVTGSISLAILLGLSAVLTIAMPVFDYPVPAGPHAVGTFDYSVIDPVRQERYEPERNREIYVEVWYPAARATADNYPVTPLYHELYEGDPYWLGIALSYLKRVPTHSHINAPLADSPGGSFPVLIFSHGAMAYTSQNQQLMEHLASHGYIIFSVGHTYDATLVNLAQSGSVRRASGQPNDLPFQLEDMERNILGKIRADSNIVSDIDISPIRVSLFKLADDYAAASSQVERDEVTQSAIAHELAQYAHLMTAETLAEYLDVIYIHQHSLMDHRVADLKLVADTFENIEYPVENFNAALDFTRIGVFGMSAGGATAGEFCKVDSRCIAGANLDGTQFGRHWSTPVPAPFLMFYHETHQGGNDFAYLPRVDDYYDYGVKGTTHFDFAELAHTLPFLQWAGFTGEIDKTRMIDILNEVQLNFFDRYMKGLDVPEALFEDIPEIQIREHVK